MISPGRIIYKVYHRPLATVRSTFKTGLMRTLAIRKGQREMQAASAYLQQITYPVKESHTVYFLTGKKYWFQTAFCLYSLQQHAGVNINAVVVDDGTFDDELEARARQQFPTTLKVVRAVEILHLLDNILPEETFPVLRQRRLVYPHLRKLTDVHILPGEDVKLVLDSDMLFFHKPNELLHWLQNPEGYLFMRDADESYGYTLPLLQTLTGTKSFPERLNVGVAGLSSSSINWHKLEFWTKSLLEKEGSSYLQEQALTAVLAAKQQINFLNETDYKVLPKIKSNTIPEILHHYVADAKYDYFVKGWKLI